MAGNKSHTCLTDHLVQSLYRLIIHTNPCGSGFPNVQKCVKYNINSMVTFAKSGSG